MINNYNNSNIIINGGTTTTSPIKQTTSSSPSTTTTTTTTTTSSFTQKRKIGLTINIDKQPQKEICTVIKHTLNNNNINKNNNNNNNININRNINNNKYINDTIILSDEESSSSSSLSSSSSSTSSSPSSSPSPSTPISLTGSRNFNLKLNLENIKPTLANINTFESPPTLKYSNNNLNSGGNNNKMIIDIIDISNNNCIKEINKEEENEYIQQEEGEGEEPLESSRWLGCDTDKFKIYDPICSKVTDYLFMGSETVASNLDILKSNGITHIINASYQCDNFFQNDQSSKFKYIKLSLRDSPLEDISLVFDQVIEFIEQARSINGKVFIHCQMGVSRSSCLCMLWIMKTTRCSLEEASDLVKQVRPISRPNAGFQLSLLNWAINEGIQAPNSHRSNYQITNYASSQFQPLALSPTLVATLMSSQQLQHQQYQLQQLQQQQLQQQQQIENNNNNGSRSNSPTFKK